jgi:citrate synthase
MTHPTCEPYWTPIAQQHKNRGARVLTYVELGPDRAEELTRESTSKAELRQRIKEMVSAGHDIPGFNHPFYSKGDPRARLLLETVANRKRLSSRTQMLLEFI